MNVENAIFEFSSELVAAAAVDAALFGSLVHLDIYEEYRAGKSIRHGDLVDAQPVVKKDADGAAYIADQRAFIDVYFVVVPDSQAPQDRVAARATSRAMADEWLLEVFANPKFRSGEGVNRICNIGGIRRSGGWIKPANIKTPYCRVRIEISG